MSKSAAMEPIRFTVPAVPVAQPRPRAVAFGGRSRVHPVTSIKSKDGSRKAHPIVAYKQLTALIARSVFRGPPLTGPLRVDLLFVFPRPANMVWKTKPMPRLRHAKTPDLDNLDKAVMDALTGLVWVDDAQVCEGSLSKWIASGDEEPRVEVEIRTLDDKINEPLNGAGNTAAALTTTLAVKEQEHG